jgi:hypothetical protein
MHKRTSCAAPAALAIGAVALAETAFACSMTTWVRASGANAAGRFLIARPRL